MPPEESQQQTPAKAGANSQDAAKGASPNASPGSGQTNAIELLKADHRQVEKLFSEFKTADENRKDQIVKEVCEALVIHTMIEEKIFYPACRAAATDEDQLNEAQVEHDGAKVLILELMNGRRGDPYRDAKVTVLGEEVKHHIGEEEKPRTGIMAKAEAAGVNTPDLARRMADAKQSLQSRGGRLPAPTPVSFTTTKEDFMARQYERERDDRGRFMDEDDDRGRGRGRGQGGWFGDSQGHSEASRRGWEERDDDRRYSRSRDDDDDRRSGRGRDHGGWFGDPEGHSEASRRGWEEREGSSRYSRSRNGDDDRRYSRSRDDDDRRSDRGQGGWFGDPEGHSEASRRGWEEREGSSRYSRGRDDDDDRRYSRSRDYDDDRRSSGRGHGGWFGDSRGHSEASREGWERRR